MITLLRRGFVSLFAVAAVTLLASGCAQMSPATEKEKVVFQVSEANPMTWNLTLNNVKNVQESLGSANVDVEIVVYGPGIGMLKADSVAGNRVGDAIKSGVKIVACENTMKGMHLTTADMLPTIGYVPGGVIELMKKQKEGYAYIRP